MRPAPNDTATPLVRILVGAALACLAILTLVDRGATRAYATPWIWLFWFAQVAPLAVLALRAFSRPRPLQLPSRAWCALAAFFAAAEILSSLLSPYRGPSVLAAVTPLAALATFFLAHDWLAVDRARRTERLVVLAGLASLAIVAASLGQWLLLDLPGSGVLHQLSRLIDYRNGHPLGHSNYTAGLALLTLSWFGALVPRTRGLTRAAWLVALVLGLAMLFSSGSRGGLIGLAAIVGATLLLVRLSRTKLVLWTAAACLAALALAYAHPRTRALFSLHRTTPSLLRVSDAQRTAMLAAGVRMGAGRPVLGWGPGTTPLAYPRFRAELDGGVEDVLELHNAPAQIWADLGAIGLLGALLFVVLAARASLPATAFCPPASVALAGYLAVSLTDYSFDVPIFAFAVALCAALIAPAPSASRHALRDDPPSRAPRLIGVAALIALVLVGLFGRRDPTAALNVRALELARDPANADRSIALLSDSLALNPDQEIAHFNLGWLLVTRHPAAAELHFLAAVHLVPDKGGVYFGLALSRLNQSRNADAARALALECLNDPLFLTSPWWRLPEITRLRPAVIATLHEFASRAATQLEARRDPRARDARYVAALADWLDGRGAPGEILARSLTPERVRFFAARPAVPDFATAPIRAYRRQRTGYPVLMRNLDLPPPIDLFDVQENGLAVEKYRFLFPAKGWLPAPILIALLDSPTPKS